MEVPAVSDKSVVARVKKLRQLVDSLGTAVAFRKLHGILDAMEVVQLLSFVLIGVYDVAL